MRANDAFGAVFFPLANAGADLLVEIGDEEFRDFHGSGFSALGFENGDDPVTEPDVLEAEGEHVTLHP